MIVLSIGPLNAPAMKGVKFAVPRQQFTIQWDDTTVVSAADVTGFVLTVQGPSGLMCGDTRSDPNAIESRCSWPPSAVGQTFNFSVSALNCGSQEGLPSEIISVTLRGKYMYVHTWQTPQTSLLSLFTVSK